MRHFLFFLIVFSMVAWNAGCAQIDECAADEMRMNGVCVPSPSKTIPVACRNSETEDPSILDWELTVSTLAIESGEPFAASLSGVAVFDEAFLDGAQEGIPGGVETFNLIALDATVHVRSGATGPDEVLTTKPIPYRCWFSNAECDPANDVLDDPPKPPGLRGNTDCEPVSDTNPCGRLVGLSTSRDCDPGGVCAGLGKSEQCSDNGFCITGDLRLELDREVGNYTADSQGMVVFGWADESTGATIENMPMFEDELGPIGLRVGVGPFPVALECVMPASAPASELISFPIETP